ncbi:MAG: hypothetical protein LBQ51_04605 [Desulfovibrio sp.]|nr:hypothetical protein [Desulfovibrio sp.]
MAFQDRAKPEVSGGDGPRGATGALIALDRDIMKLLVRRATLVSRIRGGKDQATTPAAVRAEKEVRMAWEAGAADFSKDPAFTRQLFNLLQDIKVLSREQARNAGAFGLKPPRRPVSGVLSGPADVRAAVMRIVAASCRGRPLYLEKLPPSAPILDAVKVCARVGAPAAYTYTGNGFVSVRVDEGSPLTLPGKSLFVGDDSLTAHVMIFMALNQCGTLRINGGSKLRAADLSALRNLLPLFGARMSHTIPHSRGLPVALECSGELPPQADAPADLSLDALCALLLAPPFWNVPFCINLAAVPALTATQALAEVRPLHQEFGADVEISGPRLRYTPAPLTLPKRPSVPLDPVLSAFLLALPFFARGEITLEGEWPDSTPAARETVRMLSLAGLDIERDVAGIRARNSGKACSLRLWSGGLHGALAPLFPAMCAAGPGAAHADADFVLQFFEGEELEQAREFLSRSGIAPEALGGSAASRKTGRPGPDNGPVAWTCPNAYWGMAYALAAFSRPGLLLANPGTVSEVMPSFWKIYNSLPELADPAFFSAPASEKTETPEKEETPQPTKRRIRT